MVGPLPAGGGVAGAVAQILSGLLLAAYLAFLFQKPSNAYFAARR